MTRRRVAGHRIFHFLARTTYDKSMEEKEAILLMIRTKSAICIIRASHANHATRPSSRLDFRVRFSSMRKPVERCLHRPFLINRLTDRRLRD